MKYHAQFIEDYLDALDAKQLMRKGTFIPWEDALRVSQAINNLSNNPRPYGSLK